MTTKYITLEDFKIYNKINQSNKNNFCNKSLGTCDNPATNNICTEYCLDKKIALVIAKSEDILNFLTKIGLSSKSGMLRSMEYRCKNKYMFVDVSNSIETLITKVNSFIDTL